MKYRVFPLLAVLLCLPVTAYAQPATMQQYDEQIGKPIFYLDAITLLAEDPAKTRLIVYIEIVYDNLQFLRSSRGYEATYEVDISLLAGENKDAPRYTNRIVRSSVVTRRYELTNARDRYDVTIEPIDVPPGTYTIIATLTDLESKLKSEAKKTVKVKSYEVMGLRMGDLLPAKKIRLGPDGYYEIVPNVNRTVQNPRRPLYLYYEVYPDEADTLEVYTRILNQRGEVVRENRIRLVAVHPITRDFLAFDVSDLSYGNYVLEHQVSHGDERILKGTTFRVQVAGLGHVIDDLEDAIRQLAYVTSRREIKAMLKANPVKREQMFREFWKKRDPSPETRTNELMEEYYRRIDMANELFGTFREGWETDRGEVYIRFGPPSEIERHPYEMNRKPYEIWYYYELRRRFIFVDEMGYGEYRRVSELWD